MGSESTLKIARGDFGSQKANSSGEGEGEGREWGEVGRGSLGAAHPGGFSRCGRSFTGDFCQLWKFEIQVQP